MGKWTKEEIEFLKNNYNKFSNNQLSKKINRTISSILAMKTKKGLVNHIKKWTKQEITFLKENYGRMFDKDMVKVLNRSTKDISYKRRKLGLVKNLSEVQFMRLKESSYHKERRWYDWEIDFLKNNYRKYQDKELGKKLNRTKSAISSKREELCLSKKKKFKKWSEKELEFLRETFNKLTYKEIAMKLNRSLGSVEGKINRLNLCTIPNWTDEEVNILKENCGKIFDKDIAKKLNRTKTSVYKKREHLGLFKDRKKMAKLIWDKKGKSWQDWEREIIKQNYKYKTDKEVSKLIDRSRGSITEERKKLGFSKGKNNWSKKEIDFLKKRFNELSYQQLGKLLDHSDSGIRAKANSLGFNKIKKYVEGEIDSAGKNISKSMLGIETHNLIKEDKERITNLYLHQYFTINQVGRMYNVSSTCINNALRRWGVKIRPTKFGYAGRKIRCDDGHLVKSSGEREIDNFLFHNGIIHQYEKQIGETRYRCDFYIPTINVYIEYFGLCGRDFYDKKTEEKLKLYEKLGLNLIQIYPNENVHDKLKLLIPLCAEKQKTLEVYYLDEKAH